MHPKALLDLAATLLREVLKLDAPADMVVSSFFRKNKTLGPRERATLAETAYAVLRERTLLQNLAQSGSGPLERRLAILKARPPQKITPKTCVSIPELMEELERVKAQKYSLTDQELHMSARGLAVPVVDSEGHVRATVGLAGNRDDAVWDDIDALLVDQVLADLRVHDGQSLAATDGVEGAAFTSIPDRS